MQHERPPARVAVLLYGSLIEDIGFGPYDLGTLHNSHDQQPDAAMYNRDVNGGGSARDRDRAHVILPA